MTIYYCSSVDGDDGSDGLSWTNAFATFKYAVETASAAASGPHILYVDSAHSESLTADTTITAAGSISILSVNRASSDAPLVGAVVGAQASNYAITVNVTTNLYYKVFVYGILFLSGTGSSSKGISLNSTDGGHFEYEQCSFGTGGGGASTFVVPCGGGSLQNSYTKLVNCEFRFNGATSYIRPGSLVEMYGCSIAASGTAPSVLFLQGSASTIMRAFGCDFSKITGTLVGGIEANGKQEFTFTNCKLGEAVTPMVAAVTITNNTWNHVTLYNCASGDTHYNFYHGNVLGSTTAVTTYYANDGAVCNSVNVSYKIITTANCSFWAPYVSPWIAAPRTTTGEFTPSFEGLYVDAAGGAVLDDDEIWGEWSIQGISGYSQAEFYNDRQALGARAVGTAGSDQTSAKTYADWTGSPTATDSGDTTFKLTPGAITNDEIGFVYGRVVVGEPSLTLYFDPHIRVA